MNENRRISFLVGKGGWTKVAWDGRDAYVRFTLNTDRKTWRIAEIRVLDPTSDALRSFPFSRIENGANAHSAVVLGLAVGRKAKAPPDVSKMFKGLEPAPHDRLRLRRPKGKQLDVDFYKAVALAYKGALAEGCDPRQTLARDSGAAPDTVARWVSEARRRGYLPPAQPGKVSA